MHEFKHGELEQRDGEPVKDPKQAIAIALHEAGASNQETPAKNRKALERTKDRERAGTTPIAAAEGRRKPGDAPDAGLKRKARSAKARADAEPTRAELIDEARRRGLAGRSTMRKADLQRALKTQG